MSDFDIHSLIRTAARSIAGVDRGEYCSCDEPESLGLACAKCERRIKSEEARKIIEIVGCHEFVPGLLGGLMCDVCTGRREADRHHGVAAVGRASWGASIRPLRMDAPNDSLDDWEWDS